MNASARPSPRIRRSFAAAGLFALLALFRLAGAQMDTMGLLDEPTREAVRTVAAYVHNPHCFGLPRVLAQHVPDGELQALGIEWWRYSTEEQIAGLVVCAEQAEKGQGKPLLYAIQEDMAAQFEGAAPVDLKPYLGDPPAQRPDRFTFARPPPGLTDFRSQLPDAYRKAIPDIAKFLDNNMVTVARILSHIGLQEADIAKIRAATPDAGEALERGLAMLDGPAQEAALRKTVRFVHDDRPLARGIVMEDGVAPFLDADLAAERATLLAEPFTDAQRRALLRIAEALNTAPYGEWGPLLRGLPNLDPAAADRFARNAESTYGALVEALAATPSGERDAAIRGMMAAAEPFDAALHMRPDLRNFDRAKYLASLQGEAPVSTLDGLTQAGGAGGAPEDGAAAASTRNAPKPPKPSSPGGSASHAKDLPRAVRTGAGADYPAFHARNYLASAGDDVLGQLGRGAAAAAREAAMAAAQAGAQAGAQIGGQMITANVGRAFAAMARSARGFGGVLFGSGVVSEPADLALKTIVWTSYAPGSALGTVTVTTAAGDTATYIGVPRDNAYAAYTMVYAGVPAADEPDKFDVLPWEPGDGIGLVGVHDNTPYFECGYDRPVNEGALFRVVMHPAIDNTELGWSALMGDILPIQRRILLNLIEAKDGEARRKEVQALFENLPGTWKFLDSDVRIRIREGEVAIDLEANRATMLRFRGFNLSFLGEDEDTEYGPRFDGLMRLFVEASNDYARLDRFARDLAVFRWAKQQGAKYPADKAPEKSAAEGRETPGSILIMEQDIVPGPRFESGEAMRGMLLGRLFDHLERLVAENQDAALTGEFKTARKAWFDDLEKGAKLEAEGAEIDARLEQLQAGLEEGKGLSPEQQRRIEQAQAEESAAMNRAIEQINNDENVDLAALLAAPELNRVDAVLAEISPEFKTLREKANAIEAQLTQLRAGPAKTMADLSERLGLNRAAYREWLSYVQSE